MVMETKEALYMELADDVTEIQNDFDNEDLKNVQYGLRRLKNKLLQLAEEEFEGGSE